MFESEKTSGVNARRRKIFFFSPAGGILFSITTYERTMHTYSLLLIRNPKSIGIVSTASISVFLYSIPKTLSVCPKGLAKG
jgi:hypothetical protein